MSNPDVALRDRMPRRGFPAAEKWLLEQAFKAIGPAPIRIAIQGGAELSPPGVNPLATVIIRDRRTLAELIWDTEITFGEAYADGRIQVTGDLVRALEAAYLSWPSGAAAHSWVGRVTSKCVKWCQANTLRGARDNIHHHYDLGADFYGLWLDPQLVYTCAYFESPTASLEEAQYAKLDYVCRKLHLQAGETVVEAGCGWGALALHMARNYGVRVRAFNISHEQIVHARGRALEEGLDHLVDFVEDDYRNITSTSDAFVSVGMLEHVGVENYRDLGEVIHRTVGDRGRGLLHFIGRSYQGDFSRWIRKRIFPGAHAPTLQEAMRILEPNHYSVVDIENLRPHYVKTLEHWLERFDRSSRRIGEMYSPWFERAWRLYLAGSIAGFSTGTLQLFQITFAGAKRPRDAWTRASLYAGSKCTPATF